MYLKFLSKEIYWMSSHLFEAIFMIPNELKLSIYLEIYLWLYFQ